MITANILLLSDDTEAAEIWNHIFGKHGLVTHFTPRLKEALEWKSEKVFDVILIDITSIAMDSVDILQQLRPETTIPILLLSPLHLESDVLDAYAAGVDEFISKPISFRVMLAKLQAWLNRSWTVPTSLLDTVQTATLNLDPAQRQVTIGNGDIVKLSNLEFRLLHLLMKHPGQTLESYTLIDRIWGYTGGGDVNMLKNVVYRLRRKVEPEPTQPRYIHSRPGEGYMFQP